ncbi:MAG: hypothetical protein QM817_07000 [Archangium sp.]
MAPNGTRSVRWRRRPGTAWRATSRNVVSSSISSDSSPVSRGSAAAAINIGAPSAFARSFFSVTNIALHLRGLFRRADRTRRGKAVLELDVGEHAGEFFRPFLAVALPELERALANCPRRLFRPDHELQEHEFPARIAPLEQQVGEHAFAAVIERALGDRLQRQLDLGVHLGAHSRPNVTVLSAGACRRCSCLRVCLLAVGGWLPSCPRAR